MRFVLKLHVSCLAVLALILSVGLSNVYAQSIPTDNLRLHLKADAGVATTGENVVTAWADQSGNQLSDTEPLNENTRPILVPGVINGKPVIRFSGNQVINLPAANEIGITDSDYEIFIVYRSTSVFTNGMPGSVDIQFLLSGAGEQFELHTNGGPGLRFIPNNLGDTPAPRYVDVGPGGAYTDTEPHFIRLQATDTYGEVSVNGTDVQRNIDETNGFRSSHSGPIRMGMRIDNTFRLQGDIAEVIIYNQILSEGDREAVEQYLNNKYMEVELPNFQASNITFSDVRSDRVQLNLTPGDGLGRIIFAKKGSEVDFEPQDGVTYSANNFFNSAPEFGNGNRVVYKGDGSTVTIRDLEPDKEYHFYAVEFNGDPGQEAYLLDQPARNSLTTDAFEFADERIPTDNLRLHLRADIGVSTIDDDIISYWTDQSGNFLTDTVPVDEDSSPKVVPDVINGNPVIRFSGSEAMNLPTANELGISHSDYDIFIIYSSTVSHDDVEFIMGGTTERQFEIQTNGENQAGMQYRPNSNRLLELGSTGAFTNELPQIIRLQASFTSGMLEINGSDRISINDNNRSGFSGGLVLGRRGSGGFDLRGDIAEVIMYNEKLSETDAEALYEYLSDRYIPSEPPTTQADNIEFTDVRSKRAQLNFTPGNGTGRIIFAKKGSEVNYEPQDGVMYSANNFFENAPEFGDGNRVVYKGSGTSSVTIRDLEPDETYHFYIAEYHGVPGQEVYLLDDPARNSVTTNVFEFPIADFPTENQRMHLRADLGVTKNDDNIITAWADLSSNELTDAASSSESQRPAFVTEVINGNHLEFIRFSGDQALNLPTAEEMGITNSDYEIFIVYRSLSGHSNIENILDGTANNQFKLQTNASLKGMRFVPNPSTEITVGSRSLYSNGHLQIIRMQATDTSGELEINRPDFSNSRHRSGFSSSNQNSRSSHTGGIVMGQGGTVPILPDFRMRGDIAEMIVYNEALSEADRDAVYEYLQDRYIKIRPPSTQVNNITFSDIRSDRVQLNLTPGDGVGRVIFAKKDSEVDFEPENNVTYNANNSFPNAPVVGDGNRVIYAGTGSAVTVSDLDPEETYHFYAVEYNGWPGEEVYLLSEPARNSVTTDAFAFLDDNIPTDNLRLHLRADTGIATTGDNLVTVWVDQSGNRLSDIEPLNESSRPTLVPGVIQGHPVIRFSGNEALNLPTANEIDITNKDYEIFIVYRSTDLNESVQFILGGTTHEEFEVHTNGGSSIGMRYIPKQNNYNNYIDVGNAGDYTRKLPQIIRLQATDTSGMIEINGTDRTVTDQNSRSSHAGGIIMGRRGTGGFDLRGDIAEIIIYNQKLSEADEESLYDYLIDRYFTQDPPATQPGNITFPVVLGNRIQLNLTPGDGDGRIIFAKKDFEVDYDPQSEVVYNATNSFLNAPEFGDGNRVVYKGTGTSVMITGLEPESTYHFYTAEFNFALGGVVYFISEPARGVITTNEPEFAGGVGTEEDPYQISTPYNLNNMRTNLNAHYILINDIDMDVAPYNTGEGWVPVGESESINNFRGSLNGDNHTIANLYINREGSNTGLFGATDGSTIRNIIFKDVNITGTEQLTGAIAGYLLFSVVDNVHVSGSVTGFEQVGGFAGRAFALEMNRSTSTASVTGRRSIGGFFGMLTGDPQLTRRSLVTNSYSTGLLTGENVITSLGGITGGIAFSKISNCYSLSRTVGNNITDPLVGNIVAGTSVVIENTYWSPEASGMETSIAGAAKTLAEFSQKDSFADWDFDEVWDITEGATTPWLRNDPGNHRIAMPTLEGSQGWRLLANPLSVVSYATFFSNIWTQGIEGATTSGGNPNIFLWDNTSTGSSSENWQSLTSMNNILEPGEGVLIYVYSDDDPSDEELGDEFPKTLFASGYESDGDQVMTLNDAVDGWTLVGNPFTTAINWDEFTNRSALSNSVYVWDGEGQQWLTWNGTVGDLSDGEIPPYHSFFVQTTGESPSLTIPEGAKVEESLQKIAAKGKGKAKQESIYMSLSLNHENGQSSKAWFQFSEQGSLGLDSNDAMKLTPLSDSYVMLASKLEEDVLLDINHLPIAAEYVELSLHLFATEEGQLSISLSDMNLPDNWAVSIKNDATGQEFELIEPYTLEYEEGMDNELSLLVTTSAIDDEGSMLPERFGLSQNYPNPFNPVTIFGYQLPENSEVRLEVFDMLGRRVATLINDQVEAGRHEVIFNASHLASGVYIYRLQAGNEVFTKKLTLIK